jgi:molybdopterin-guanine dinucleotide biosynthesis protein A
MSDTECRAREVRDAVESVTPVVLAGGSSERFGGHAKATATLGDQPLIGRIVDAVRTATENTPVIAVGNPTKRTIVESAVDGGVHYRYDADWCQGPLAGVVGALDAVPTAVTFLCGCDMPCLAPSVVEWLADEYAARPVDVLVPTAHGRTHPIHAVYSRDALDRYCQTRPDDDRLCAALDCLDTRVVSTDAAPASVPLTRSVTNVNTRSQLAKLRRFTSGGEPG